MKLLTYLFIIRAFLAEGFRGIRMTADINDVVRNKYFLQNSSTVNGFIFNTKFKKKVYVV